MSQISLAWQLANPAITAPIIGASSIEQLEENVDVVDQTLPEYALKRINDVSKPEWLLQKEARRVRMRR
jgi:aryl-alcohol dehydrogenase-like predicted oxidoreductase